VRVSFATRQSVGSGESATDINAFSIEVVDQAGRQDWRVKFHVLGIFGQGPKQLFIEASDRALGERLERSGVLDAVSAVSSPTRDYVTVAYDARRRSLTYTDDVSPRRISSRERFAAQLALVARLAEINAQVNPA
jgi:hypothetical protein